MSNISENITDYVPVYREMADIVGVENTIKIYQHFKGQQLTLPQRLYTTEYVTEYVKKHYNGTNLRELARKFGYSERRIREFLKNKRKNKGM